MRRNPLTWRQVSPTQQANTTGALNQFANSTVKVFSSLKDTYDQQRAVNTANMLNDLIAGKPIRNIKGGNFDSNALNDASMSLERKKLADEATRANIEKSKAETEFKLAQALQQQTQNDYLPQSLLDSQQINKTKVSMAEFSEQNKGRVLDSALANEASRTRLNNFKSNPFNSLAETKIPASVINANNKAQTALTEELTKSYRNKEIPINVKLNKTKRIKYGIDKKLIDNQKTYEKKQRAVINNKYDKLLKDLKTENISTKKKDTKSTSKSNRVLGTYYGSSVNPKSNSKLQLSLPVASDVDFSTRDRINTISSDLESARKRDLTEFSKKKQKMYDDYIAKTLTNKDNRGNFIVPTTIKGTRKLTDAEILKKVNPNGLYEMIGALTGINANKDEDIKDKVKELTKRLKDIKDSKKRISSRKDLLNKLNALTDDNDEVSKQKIIDFLDNFENSITG